MAALSLLAAACTKKPPPSVLFVTFDTTRYDHIGADGDSEARTPTVDALAAEGMTFDRAYATVALTLPSHTTMMSGLWPIEHGVHNNGRYRVPDEVETLAERLKPAGFETAAFVSAFVLDERYNLGQGFDVYDDRTNARAGALNMAVPSRPGNEVADSAIEWLGGRSPQKPFFLWTHFYDPHHPLEPPKPYADEMSSKYAAEIAFADAELARVLKIAREKAGDRGLLVVFTADHGESHGEHDEATHGLVAYDSTLHVPLILAGPGIARGVRSDALARHIDLVPTILEELGLPRATHLTGRSLLALAGHHPDDDALGYFESRGPHIDLGWSIIEGVRTARWKYTAGPEPRELFDILADPREQQNRIEEHPEIAREMEARWQELRESAKPQGGDSEIKETSLEAAEQLAALGYVQAPQKFESGEAPDPRRFVGTHAWVDGARSAAQAGRYREALQMLETLRESQSVRALVLRTLAPIYGELGRTDDAIKAYDEYVQLTDSEESKVGVARLLLEAGRYDEALARLEGVKFRSPRVTLVRAYALARSGKIDEARAFVKGHGGGKATRGRRRLWASVVVDTAPQPTGEADLRELVAEDPKDAALRSKLGYYLAVWGKKEQGEEGLRLLQEAAKESPNDADAVSNLGWAAYKRGNDVLARESLEKAIELDRNRQLDRFRLAYPLRRLGETEKALQAAQRALAVQPAAYWAPTAKKLIAELSAERSRAGKAAKPSAPSAG